MHQVTQLVEQQVHAWEWHLKHVDELMQRARAGSMNRPAPAQTANRQDQALYASARFTPKSVKRVEGMTGVLEAVGLQFEKALTSILETGRR